MRLVRTPPKNRRRCWRGRSLLHVRPIRRATLSALGSQINRSHPSFDPRNYGVAKLGELIRQQAAYLEVKDVKLGEGDAVQTHLHVRRKAAGSAKVG